MEPVTISILLAIGKFTTDSITSGITYDVIKKLAKPFTERLAHFFGDVDKTENFMRQIIEKPSRNPHKPRRDVEDIYEEITSNQLPEELYEELEAWIAENREFLKEAATSRGVQFTQKIGSQTAGRDIVNAGTINMTR
ncbi:hypothetical protein Desor_0684 [Desulfosporosinus orientis DSM 765]|uniref:Uncharacterized protein n=1 Tax=Desulfosporosinus orientis (strain ATCC 19365 / DSM 765 / NCIMB 8382 / VKM B-1628 / Singapore I) TaxID=768706 RepID=G7W5E6_DESOD|nr:hypothetical protein [Desulfosporosinus orientis]AET66374.1 hypothetical protein Desor_0684 [Desulfosporosinus orientis DSM 765]